MISVYVQAYLEPLWADTGVPGPGGRAGQHGAAVRILVKQIAAMNPDTTPGMLMCECRLGNGVLQEWMLDYRCIERLPESFGTVRTLGRLNLRDNALKGLPESFGNIVVGGTLDLNGTNLQRLPESFASISVGGDLDLRYNHLEYCPPTRDFPNLVGRVYHNSDDGSHVQHTLS